jgi:hypothetical protein
MQIIFFCDI